MESKLLVGGKNIVDHTNEQQKILEQKRQEIAEQVRWRSLLVLEAVFSESPVVAFKCFALFSVSLWVKKTSGLLGHNLLRTFPEPALLKVNNH